MKDVLLVTWHGIHELEIFPGLPDTGGQNIYVQNMARVIHDRHDCRVTILNRGGYSHPYTGRVREGYSKDPDRELYVLHAADSIRAFLRKEFLTPALIEDAFTNAVSQLPADYQPDFIISHFWDGGIMGNHLHQRYPDAVHIWIPHEPVGIKKAPLSTNQFDRHGIELRDICEKRVVENACFLGSTSSLVRNDLCGYYSGAHDDKIIDVFPGVDTKRFHPAEPRQLAREKVAAYSALLGIPADAFRARHICEFGRSDSLKCKEKAVEAFARVCASVDDVVMFTNVDAQMEPAIAAKVDRVIADAKIGDRVFVLSPKQLPQAGESASILPDLMQTSEVFLTMSEMEGFGMAACESAACGIPVVGTEMIPVLTDIIAPAGGGIVVDSGDTEAAAEAIRRILCLDKNAHAAMCAKAYSSVVPKFTWEAIVQGMFDQVHSKGINTFASAVRATNGNGNGRVAT